jgi:hypothetical protein
LGVGSLQEETTVLNTLTGDPNLSHPENVKYSKQWKKKNNLKHLSSGEPTYWPSDRNKLSYLVNFCVTKRILQDFVTVKFCFNLSSEHSPVLVTLTHEKNQEKQPCLSNRYTNRDDFRHLVNEKLTLEFPFNTEENIEAAVKFFNDTIHRAGWNATLGHTDILTTLDCLNK